MARYRAKERGQIPAAEVQPTKRADASPSRKVMRIVEKGEEFDFYGKPGSWMEPVKGGSQTDQGGQGKSPAGRQTTRGSQTDQGGAQGQANGEGSATASP